MIKETFESYYGEYFYCLLWKESHPTDENKERYNTAYHAMFAYVHGLEAEIERLTERLKWANSLLESNALTMPEE